MGDISLVGASYKILVKVLIKRFLGGIRDSECDFLSVKQSVNGASNARV